MLRLVRHSGALALLLGALSTTALAQAGTVRGRVIDAATGAPIASDASGAFTIGAVPSGAQTLVVHRIGYSPARQPISVTAGASDVAVSLESAPTSLERVIVAGSATPTTVRALGTSVASVDGSEVAAARPVAVDQALHGKVAGAQITQNSGNPGGGGLSVRLRGTSSIISGSEPLYIVDGIILDNSSNQLIDFGARSNVQNRLADLDPNDIERIEIVRGAAAAALYGSRANNGVVQIFTKRGRSGAPRITLGTSYTGEHIAKRLALNMAPLDAAGNPVTRHDYQNDIFHPRNLKETNISAEGGTDRTTYYFGGSYTDEEGIIRSSSACAGARD